MLVLKEHIKVICSCLVGAPMTQDGNNGGRRGRDRDGGGITVVMARGV